MDDLSRFVPVPLEKKKNSSIGSAEEELHDRFRRASEVRKKIKAAKNRKVAFQKFIQKKIEEQI